MAFWTGARLGQRVVHAPGIASRAHALRRVSADVGQAVHPFALAVESRQELAEVS